MADDDDDRKRTIPLRPPPAGNALFRELAGLIRMDVAAAKHFLGDILRHANLEPGKLTADQARLLVPQLETALPRYLTAEQATASVNAIRQHLTTPR